MWKLAAVPRAGRSAESVSLETGIDPFGFSRALSKIIEMERQLLAEELTPDLMRKAKRMGFFPMLKSDRLRIIFRSR
ncbi:MAG: hypothetical protein Ct9H300mP19_00970 [Dehalococcoidia bacterium]|nr:MAG: hypothetical protein Ct9H300mP19_00970 [Dehalococcoidia bacterium]